MIAEVIINTTAKELNKTFDYFIPHTIEKSIQIGSRVVVPFGEKRKTDGYVITIKEKSEFATKEILELADNYLSTEQIDFAKLMSKRYFCNLSDCVKLLLPPGKLRKRKIKTIKSIIKRKEHDNPLLLTPEQECAFRRVEETIEDNIHKEFLLYGVTGSRKNGSIFAVNPKSFRKK